MLRLLRYAALRGISLQVLYLCYNRLWHLMLYYTVVY